MKNFLKGYFLVIALRSIIVLGGAICLFFELGERAIGNDKMNASANLTITAYATFGQGGPRREIAETVGGGTIFFTVQLHGLKQNTDGGYDFEAKMEILGSDSKVFYTYPLISQVVRTHLPDSDVFLTNSCFFPINQPNGKYKVHIQVCDKSTNEVASASLNITVLPPSAFGAEEIGYFLDKDLKYPAGGNVTLGDEIFLYFRVVGFQSKDNITNIQCHAYGTDENGKQLGPDLFTASIREDDNGDQHKSGITVQKNIPCYRTGSYRLVLELDDLVSNQTATYELPLVIHGNSINELAIPHALKNQTIETSAATLSDASKGDAENNQIKNPSNPKTVSSVNLEKDEDGTNPSIKISFDQPAGSPFNSNSILAGDTLTYNLSLGNLAQNEEGYVDCELEHFIEDVNGNAISPRGHDHLQFNFWLGQHDFLYHDYLAIPANFLPGKYKFVAKVFDRISKKSIESMKEFDIIPNKDFHIITSRLIPNLNSWICNYGNCTAGNCFSIFFGLTNYEKNGINPSIQAQISLFDEKGRLVVSDSVSADSKMIKTNSNCMISTITEWNSCPGKYLYRFEAIDQITEKKSIRIVPVIVWPQLGNAKEKRSVSL